MKKFLSVPFFMCGLFVTGLLINAPNAMAGSVFKTYQVQADADDAEQDKSNGSISLNDSKLELGANGSTDQIIGVRFQDVDIPDGATIKSAHLRFFNRATEDSDGIMNLSITGESIADSPIFANSLNNISDRDQTSSKVTWNPDEWGDANVEAWEGEQWESAEKHKTADITSIVNDIISSGFTTGNAMSFFIEDEADSGNSRVAHSADYTTYDRMPRLIIEYEATEPACTLTPNILGGIPYLPDYSYAGYKWGEEEVPSYNASSPGITYVDVTTYGATPNDSSDDTDEILAAIAAHQNTPGTVVLHFPAGNFKISDVITIDRSDFVIQGSGSGAGGTSFQIDIPLSDSSVTKSQDVQDLIDWWNSSSWPTIGTRQYSPYTYTGGFFYAHYDGNRYTKTELADVTGAVQGETTFTVNDASSLNVGDVVNFEWANDGSDDFVDYLVDGDCSALGYGSCGSSDNKVSQPVTITAINGSTVTIKEPLMHSLHTAARLRTSNYIENVGFENFSVNFPDVPAEEHHFEAGYNALYVADVNNSWVKNIAIDNADSGVMMDFSKNSIVDDLNTTGRNNHYNLMFANSYGLLGQNFNLEPEAEHNPSFNTANTMSVFKDGYVEIGALDQHAGLNHFNLFDNITIGHSDDLFKHGGSSSSSPTAGIYNTFWNTKVYELGYNNLAGEIQKAPEARIIGLHSPGNTLSIDYNPAPYVEGLNECLAVESLYDYQLTDRGQTPTPDTTPDAFTFTDVTGADPSTEYVSNTITVAGINEATPISISGADEEYRINGGTWANTPGTVQNGDVVEVKVTSSASYNTPVSTTLDIGGVTDAFDVTTKADSATAPTLTETTPVAPPTNNNTPDYTFHTTGTGTIAFGGGCASLNTTAEVGNNTITFSELADGTYDNCTVTLTDGSGNVTDPLDISDFVVDTTEPVRSNGSPDSDLPAGTINSTMSLSTNENATCRYSTTIGVDYDSMTQPFGGAGSTTHSVSLSGLVDGSSYMYYVKCVDTAGNDNTTDYPISFNVEAGTNDTQPPVRSNGDPTGLLSAGTTSTPISLNTDENAICRYATSTGVAYDSMTSFLGGGGSTAHSANVTVADGNSYHYYIKCRDNFGNTNLDDYVITFNVATDPLVANFHANVFSGNAPLTVQFTDDSVGSISAWAWDFDNDGTIDSTQQNPSYNYSAPGVYSVALTVSNAGNSDTETKYSYIVVADPTSANPYLQVIKDGLGAGNVTSNVSGISCGTDCYNTYAMGSSLVLTANPDSGSVFDNWTVYTGSGSSTFTGTNLNLTLDGNTTAVANFDLVDSLTANFMATQTTGTAFFGTHFIDTSTGQPTSWQWDFDNDGIVDSTEQNPYYVFTEPGTYSVRLVVSNGSLTDQEIKMSYIVATEATTPTPGSTHSSGSSRYTGIGGGQNAMRHGDYDVNDRNAGFFGAPYINPVNIKTSILKVPTLCGVPESSYVTHNLYNLIRRTTGLPVQCASELTLVPQSLQLGQRDIFVMLLVGIIN